VKRVTLIARLRTDARERAAKLLAAGPPFQLEQTHLLRHSVFLGPETVAFFFEGPDVDAEIDGLTSDAFHPALQEALGAWRELIDEPPVIAREVFFWERPRPGAASL
jgi:hypothetical protein